MCSMMRRGYDPFVPVAGRVDLGAALIAVAAEEPGHLGLQRGLQQQLGAEAGNLLDDTGEGTGLGEHPIDLGPQPLTGRYSTGHGRGVLSRELGSDREEPTSVVIYTEAATRPCR